MSFVCRPLFVVSATAHGGLVLNMSCLTFNPCHVMFILNLSQ